MVRPFALVGLSGYGALVLCAALGPGSAWALALLCLGLACVTLACRACLGFAAQRKGLLTWQEPSDVYPRALALFQGLFWVAAALAVTLTDRAWRTGKWGASWATQVLEAWKGRPKGESEMDYIIHDGLHPLRIAEYAGSFLRVTSKRT